jgi:regulator of RNase E activity RraA
LILASNYIIAFKESHRQTNTMEFNGMTYLTIEQLNSLKEIDTPTVANAVETHESRLNTEGFMGWNIRCQFPDLGVMVGQAVTATLNTTTTGKPKSREIWYDCVEAIDAMPVPAVIVAKDTSPRPFHGCHFGDGMANLAKRVGCIGLVTDGGVRDVETVHEMGFQMFAVGTVPAHGNFGLDETQVPVEVSGVLVNPGDVVHADVNGVVVFPVELADYVISEAQKVTERESAQFDWVLSDDFSVEKLRNRG